MRVVTSVDLRCLRYARHVNVTLLDLEGQSSILRAEEVATWNIAPGCVGELGGIRTDDFCQISIDFEK